MQILKETEAGVPGEDAVPRAKAQLCRTASGYLVRIVGRGGDPLYVGKPKTTPEQAVDDMRLLRVTMRRLSFRSLLEQEPSAPIPFRRPGSLPEEPPPTTPDRSA